MEEKVLAVGDVVINKKDNAQFRILHIQNGMVFLCQMQVTKLNIFNFEVGPLISFIDDGTFAIKEREPDKVFDIDNIPDTVREKFEKKRAMMHELDTLYGPTFIALADHKANPAFKALVDKYGFNVSTVRRCLIRYLQSGFQDVSLIDNDCLGVHKGQVPTKGKRTGRKSQYNNIAGGFLVTPEVKEKFADALNLYKSGRFKSLDKVYEHMVHENFSVEEYIDNRVIVSPLPENQRPSLRQLRYYFDINLNKKDRDCIKTSKMEQTNNKRLLMSDSLYDVFGPGDMCEIDACEVDVSLVSELDPNQTIGRPIVYFLVDVYTKAIVAMSVGLDNNSIIGLSSLFLNLADDKRKYCKRYDLDFTNDMNWPSNFIPKRIRVDRGADFVSKKFVDMCSCLGIELNIVPGGSGSLKGTVESKFAQLQKSQIEALENNGLITKRHDSQHHKEACLNISQYTQIVIRFVNNHNQLANDRYPLTPDMIALKIPPIPARLWEYGVEKYGALRPIANMDQYLYNLLIPKDATISRKGICYDDLWYLPEQEDNQVYSDMFDAGNKKVPFDIRIDLRDVSSVYYYRDNTLHVATLNTRITGNNYAGKTFKEYEEYKRERKRILAECRETNLRIDIDTTISNTAIVNNAKSHSSEKRNLKTQNMRAAREAEKQAISYKNNVRQRLDNQNDSSVDGQTIMDTRPKLDETVDVDTVETVGIKSEIINVPQHQTIEKKGGDDEYEEFETFWG